MPCVCVGLSVCVCLNKPAASCEQFLTLLCCTVSGAWIYSVAPPVEMLFPFYQVVDVVIYLKASFDLK